MNTTRQKNIAFTKMVGAGNDFIILEHQPRLNVRRLAQKACDRTNGIGADGILLLEPSQKADYRMRIINADGSEAEMCGNGARCMAVYIALHKNPPRRPFTIETLAGTIHAETGRESARIRLSDPRDYRAGIPLRTEQGILHVHYIDTGVPHAILFVDDLENTDIQKLGPFIRYHQEFVPRGANANFVQFIDDSLVANRTYERGVEGETKACGTGSVASALVACVQRHPQCRHKKGGRIRVRTLSGEILQVQFDLNDKTFTNVWLTGSARFIAEGQYLY